MSTVNCQLLKYSNQIRLPLNFAKIQPIEYLSIGLGLKPHHLVAAKSGRQHEFSNRGATNYRRLPDWSYISR